MKAMVLVLRTILELFIKRHAYGGAHIIPPDYSSLSRALNVREQFSRMVRLASRVGGVKTSKRLFHWTLLFNPKPVITHTECGIEALLQWIPFDNEPHVFGRIAQLS